MKKGLRGNYCFETGWKQTYVVILHSRNEAN